MSTGRNSSKSLLNAVKRSQITHRIQRFRIYEPLRFLVPTVRLAVSQHESQGKHFIPWLQSWFVGDRLPWWSFESLNAVERVLQEFGGQANVFEYGSGFSTRWLAKRSGFVVSVESDLAWFQRTRDLLSNCPNAHVILAPASTLSPHMPGQCLRCAEIDGCFSDYVEVVTRYPDQYFDLVVVDGFSRNASLEQAKSKVRPGGVIFLDDAQRESYDLGLSLLKDWESLRTTGIRPRSLPNEGILLRRPS